MDVMSVQDAAFLHIENGNNPMHIGSVAVLEGPAPPMATWSGSSRASCRWCPDTARRCASPRAASDARCGSTTLTSRSCITYATPRFRRPAARDELRNLAGRRVRADARPQQAALGDLDGRGLEAWSMGGDLQGASLHGRRRLRHRPAHRDVRQHRRDRRRKPPAADWTPEPEPGTFTLDDPRRCCAPSPIRSVASATSPAHCASPRDREHGLLRVRCCSARSPSGASAQRRRSTDRSGRIAAGVGRRPASTT